METKPLPLPCPFCGQEPRAALDDSPSAEATELRDIVRALVASWGIDAPDPSAHALAMEDAARALARLQGHPAVIVASARPVLGQKGDERVDEMAWTVGLAVR